jgi:predicted nucleotidyltransferase
VIKSCDRDSIAAAVRRHVDRLREEHPEIKRAIWFGSWVKGIPSPGSDVDLCLILSSSEKSLRDRVPDYLPVGFPVGIDLFPYTEDEFRELEARSPAWYAAILSGEEI